MHLFVPYSWRSAWPGSNNEIAKWRPILFPIGTTCRRGSGMWTASEVLWQLEDTGPADLLVGCGLARSPIRDFHNVSKHRDGIRLRPRERFVISVPKGFPFNKPETWTTHTRFAGHPHVQWKRQLCLYQSPATEWDVSDGIYGFMERLDQWVRAAAASRASPARAWPAQTSWIQRVPLSIRQSPTPSQAQPLSARD